jgi:hypothetical protein
MIRRALGLLLLVFSIHFIFGSNAQAQIEHQLIRRMVVFPVKAPAELSAAAEEAWWQARDELTKNKRFLVASKQFLLKSDTFQPRGDLEPADVLILGKLLDAHALITMQMTAADRRIIMTVYDTANGLVLWRKSVLLHPSIPINDQIATISRKLIDDFTANIPYQGYTTIDALQGAPVYEDGDVKLAQIDLGFSTGAQIGDVVQWLKIIATTTAPIFQGGAKMSIFAEGKIVRIDQGVATVEITRATSLNDIKEYALVRLPRESERMKTAYTISESPRNTLTAELVAPEAQPMQQIAKERRPLIATLSFIGSIAAYLLLAF